MSCILQVKDANGNWIGVPATVGPPGPKPERGVDYWTEADKEEMVQETLSRILSGDEVSY